MNVLLVSPKMENPNGGIAIWTDVYLSSCDNLGISYTLVNTQPVGARAKNGNAKRSFSDEIKRTKAIFSQLKEALQINEHDVAHINTSCGTFGIIRDYLIAKRIKKASPNTKIVIHYHCDIPFQVKGRIGRFFLSKLTKFADVHLALCENSKRYLKERFSCESIKIPNFINESVVRCDEKSISQDVRRAFFVGRVSREKGAVELYELARRFPDINFCLAGALTDELSDIERPKNVELTGAIPHDLVLDHMDKSDVFVFPTHSEGFSVALMEAMARGLPVITTDVGANRDMIEDFGGIIVEVENVDALEAAMETIRPQDVRKTMSTGNISKVRDNYTTEAVMKKIIASYEG